jgi:hypothetical protein
MTQAELYFYDNITKPDLRYMTFKKTKYRNKDCIKVEPVIEGLNVSGYWCSEEFAKELHDIRYKDEKCRTPYEIDLLNCAYEFFMKEMCEFDDFADWDNYTRFINAMDDDFLESLM